MRAIWKGAISFGLVTIGVRLFTATEERNVAFHQVHRTDGGRIRYKRICQVDGDEIPYGDIAKGYELPDGQMVVLTDDDLAELPLSSSRAIEVLAFVPLEQVDPIYFSKSYYLEPDQQAGKPYVLLREAMTAADRVAIVKVALRQREALATLRVRDDVLVLETMSWPDEIRTPDFGFLADAAALAPRDQELAMAHTLIDSMTQDFDPGQYTDGYREAIDKVIDAKIAGNDVVNPSDSDGGGDDAPGGVIDLMAALRASVERSGSSAKSTTSSSTKESSTKDSSTRDRSGSGRGKASEGRGGKDATSAKSTKQSSDGKKSESTSSAATSAGDTTTEAKARTGKGGTRRSA